MAIVLLPFQEEFVLSQKPLCIIGGDPGTGRSMALVYQLVLRALSRQGRFIFMVPRLKEGDKTPRRFRILEDLLNATGTNWRWRTDDTVTLGNGSVIQAYGRAGHIGARINLTNLTGIAVEEINRMSVETVQTIKNIVINGGWLSATYLDKPGVDTPNSPFFATNTAWIRAMQDNQNCLHLRSRPLGQKGFLPARFLEHLTEVKSKFGRLAGAS